MTLQNINTLVASMATDIDCEYAYYQFEGGATPPFIVFYVPNEEKFVADGINYANVKNVRIELYTDNKEPVMEQKIETILKNNGLAYDKSETYINGEHLFEEIYELEVI